jgi:hypothetical protein
VSSLRTLLASLLAGCICAAPFVAEATDGARLLSCADVRFPADAISGPPLVAGADPIDDAVMKFDFREQTSLGNVTEVKAFWKVASNADKRVYLLRYHANTAYTEILWVTLDGTDKPKTAGSSGCVVRHVVDDQPTVPWRIVARGSSGRTVDVELTNPYCGGSTNDKPKVRVEYRKKTVAIGITVPPPQLSPGAVACPKNLPQVLRIKLREAIGKRSLVDLGAP